MTARDLVTLSSAAKALGLARTTISTWANRDGLLQPVGMSPDGIALYDLASVRAIAAERTRRRRPRG